MYFKVLCSVTNTTMQNLYGNFWLLFVYDVHTTKCHGLKDNDEKFWLLPYACLVRHSWNQFSLHKEEGREDVFVVPKSLRATKSETKPGPSTRRREFERGFVIREKLVKRAKSPIYFFKESSTLEKNLMFFPPDFFLPIVQTDNNKQMKWYY